MKRISALKKLFKRNKSAAYIGAAVLCCILVVSGLLLFMPKGYAENFSGYNELSLTLGNNNRWSADMQAGEYYYLDGDNNTFNSGIDITIKGTSNNGNNGNPYKVYLILHNVNIDLTKDESGITFQLEDGADKLEQISQPNVFMPDNLEGSKVEIHLLLSGDSSITGSNGAESALIQAENYKFVTETYYSAGGEHAKGKFIYYSQHLELIIESYNGENYKDSLTLTTGNNSYGAAIGGSGNNSTLIKTKLDAAEIKDDDYSSYPYEEDPYAVPPYSYYTDGTFLVDLSRFGYVMPSLQYGAADVTIESGIVNIKGNGYGAGIGNGGYDNPENREFTTLYKDKITASVQQQGIPSVRIEDGTVSVVMSNNSKGSCFVNGSVGKSVADDGRVTIMGGSVYLERQGNVAEGRTYYKEAYNDEGDQLYAYAAHYNEDAAKIYEDEGYITGLELDLDNICYTEEEKQYIISEFIDVDGKNDYKEKNLDYLKTYVSIPNKGYQDDKYKFTGFGYNYDDKDDTLYFYLPASRLEQYELAINDNVGNNANFAPEYKVAVLSEEQINKSEDYNKYDYTPYEDAPLIKQTKYVLVQISGTIPEYCTDIIATYKQENGNGETDVKAVYNETDGNWYLKTLQVTGNMAIDFVYKVGTYTIEYHYGLIGDDINEENAIENPNITSNDCGTKFDLEDAKWEGRIFEGWYRDEQLQDKIESVGSDKLDDIIDVYAKWSCEVVYKIEGNIGTFISTGKDEIRIPVPYGEKFDIMDAGHLPDSEKDINMGESSELFEFKGWEYNGKIYNDENRIEQITVLKETYINAVYERNGFYVYITATYGDDTDTHRDIKDYLGENTDNTFRMIYSGGEEKNIISNSADDKGYYWSTSLLYSEYVTVTLVPKAGYKIEGKAVTDGNGNPINLFDKDETSDSNINEFSFSMYGINKDIYIFVHFDVEEYTIEYYDCINNNYNAINDGLNPTVYNVNSTDISFVRPRTDRDKYWKFLGFTEMGKDEIITGIPAGSRTGNLILVAQWEEIEVYNININEGVGIIKAYVDGEEVTRAADGETVTLVATVNPGIRLNRIEYKWEAEIDHDTIESYKYNGVTNTTITITFTMPAADVEVNGYFEIIQYVITYLNLNGAVNENPSIYTVFDSFDLVNPVKEGWTFKGWRLIVPNDDTLDDIADVKMIDIEKVENRFGNLMIYADWEEGDDISAVYHAYVDSGIVNGQVELAKTEASESEWIIVKVSENEGYELSQLVYTPEVSSQMLRISPLERYSQRSVAVDISINKLADGLYYFVMPASDVEITAVFEPVTYSISYIANGGQYDNVDHYTIEDEIILNDAIKSGYTFDGWYNENGEKVEKIYYSTGNMVLSARWMTVIDNDNTGNEDDNTGDENNGDEGGQNIDEDDNDAKDENPSTAEEKPNTYVTGNIKTGDSVDVARLIIICVICVAVLLLLIIPKKKKEDEDEDENKDETKQQ